MNSPTPVSKESLPADDMRRPLHEGFPRDRRQAEARARLAVGRQLLLYAPQGPLGGTFSCPVCGTAGMQPDLLDHAAQCLYARRVEPRAGAS